jgi:hypothetical protein
MPLMVLRSASELRRSDALVGLATGVGPATVVGVAAVLVGWSVLMPRSLQAAENPELAPMAVTGVVELSSRISPVDACNRAQGQRPAGAVVTDMEYERLGEPGEPRLFNCRISWSTAEDAQPTRRPILFGPTP